MTNFLDYHFGAGASKQFGNKFDDVVAALKGGASQPTDELRKPFYVEANNLLAKHVPMVPIAHGASGTAYKADVEGAHSSPLSNEYFAVMNPGGRDTFTWLQNGEPAGLYCADETDGEFLRVCEQVTEALLSYEIGGTAVQPALAESCDAQRRPDRVDLQTPRGRQVPRRLRLRRQRRRDVLGGPVGRGQPAAQGPHRPVHLLLGALERLPERAGPVVPFLSMAGGCAASHR